MPVVTALRAARGGGFELEIDGAPCCRLSGALMAQWCLVEGQELDGEQVERLRGAAATDGALVAAYALLERRARSRSEVAARLRSRGYVENIIDGVLARLTRQGLIDDEDFARRYVADKRALEDWGSIRIRRGLAALGVEGAIVDAVLAGEPEEDDEEFARALRVLRRKGPTRPPLEATQRRAYQALLRKGFPAAVAYRAVRVWASEPTGLEEE